MDLRLKGDRLSSSVTIQLARTRSEFESAFRLLQRSRENYGLDRHEPEKIWLLKHHALPSTNTIIALHEGKIVGAICLFGESPFQLPMESHLDLHAFRENLEGRLAELSLPGFCADYAENADLRFALYHFAMCFGASYCHYDGFVTEAPLTWAKEFAQRFHYEKIYEPMEERQILFLNARAGFDFRTQISRGYPAEYRFPEKKFFLVAHQSMPANVVNFLFNKRTKLFNTLNDFELRVLKNIYDYGDYANVLPSRPLVMPEKKTPRYPRFPMNCEGFLVNEQGEREHVLVLDVSREGLKIRVPLALEKGASYVLTLFVGVNKRTELIATIVWTDELAEMAGLEIKSYDQSWTQLIEYLERDFLQIA